MLAKNNNNITISRVTNLSEHMMKDCYYVIMQSLPAQAEEFYCCAMRDVNHKNHILFVASTPFMVVGVIKGMVFEMPDAVYAKIECFCVDKKYRCRGIGRQLLDAYENCVIRERGVSCIGLQSATSALRFYRNNGYVGKFFMKKTVTR